MKLFADLYQVEELSTDIGVLADGFVVGHPQLTRSFGRTMDFEELQMSVKKVHQQGKTIAMLVNTMLMESLRSSMEEALLTLFSLEIDYYFCFDLSWIRFFQKHHQVSRMIYAPGTLMTNHFDIRFAEQLELGGVILGRELRLDEIQAMASTKHRLLLGFDGYGYIELFTSKRPLLSAYFESMGTTHNSHFRDLGYRLVEPLRPDQELPILEDSFGTTIFRPQPQVSFSVWNQIDTQIDFFHLSRMFMEDLPYIESLQAHRFPKKRDLFLKKYPHHDSGFLFSSVGLIKEKGH